MKIVHVLDCLLVAAALALTASAHAQSTASDHASHHPAAAASTASSSAAPTSTEGEVRKVDKDQGKVTLKHGPIENLGMPGMTMVFKAADPKMLDALKPGDKVKFAAENIAGALTVTAIEPAK